MRIPETHSCDVCGKRQLVEGGRIQTAGWYGASFDPLGNGLTLKPWAEWRHMTDTTHHLCSRGCSLVLTERYLQGQLLSESMLCEREGAAAR